MATPIIDQLSKDLAYKLQDPVNGGTVNGTRISAAERFRYILRGYRRLVRVVTILYPEMINKLFPKFFLVTGQTTDGSGTWELSDYIEQVFEVLAKEPVQETYVRATYVGPQEWLSVKQGINTFYYPDLNQRQYYWTMQQGMLEIYPPTIYNVTLSTQFDYSKQLEAYGQSGPLDIDIPTEYRDILLAAATAEAYLDIGQPDLANAHMNDFMAQVQIFSAKMQKMEQKNEG